MLKKTYGKLVYSLDRRWTPLPSKFKKQEKMQLFFWGSKETDKNKGDRPLTELLGFEPKNNPN